MKRVNKRGSLLQAVVWAVLAIMFILAASWVVFKILVFIGLLTPQVQCDWSIVLIAISKLGTAGLVDVPPECSVDLATITAESLQDKLDEAEAAMKLYQNDDRYRFAKEVFGDPNSEALQYEWALNEKIGSYMSKCWNRVWQGKLPLFDSWWNLIDYQGFSRLTSEQEAASQYRSSTGAFTIPFSDGQKSLFQVYGPPTFCIYCARLKIDPSVKSAIGKDRVTSFDEYARAVQASPTSSESLFEFLLDESAKESDQATVQRSLKWDYNIDESLAIQFVRVNYFGADLSSYSTAVDEIIGSAGLRSETKNARVNRLVIGPARTSLFPFGTQAIKNGEVEAIQCLQQIK